MVQKKLSFAPRILETEPTTTMITQSKKRRAGTIRSNLTNKVFILNKLYLYINSKVDQTETKIIKMN